MRNLSGIWFFVLFVFINFNSAQTIEKTALQKDEADFFAVQNRQKADLGKNPFAEKDEAVKPFENRSFRDLQKNLRDDKAESPAPDNYKLLRGEKEWNFEFGYSPFEPTHFTGEKEYNTAGRKLGVAVVRWGRVIGTKGPITWQYLFEAVPFVISLKNEVTNPDYVSATATPDQTPTKRETSYGFGLTPAAFRLYFLPRSRIKPYLQFGAGFLITNKPMPLPETSWFNFTSYWGGGVMYQIKRDRAITFSYRYLHISNASLTRFNPGYNANVFALGYSVFYGK